MKRCKVVNVLVYEIGCGRMGLAHGVKLHHQHSGKGRT